MTTENKKTNQTKILPLTMGVIILSLLIVVFIQAQTWVHPTATPPGGNVTIPMAGAMPPGSIIMYSGAWNFDATGLGTGPLVGWALANGNNGTPNLTDRFVRGTGTAEGMGATGGSTYHSVNEYWVEPETRHWKRTYTIGAHREIGSWETATMRTFDPRAGMFRTTRRWEGVPGVAVHHTWPEREEAALVRTRELGASWTRGVITAGHPSYAVSGIDWMARQMVEQGISNVNPPFLQLAYIMKL